MEEVSRKERFGMIILAIFTVSFGIWLLVGVCIIANTK